MRFDIITLFPRIFDSYFNESILKRAREKKLVEIAVHNLRDFSSDKKHKKVDDRPYGGGAGMVLMAEPILDCVEKLQSKKFKSLKTKIIVLSAKGRQFNQKLAYNWAKKYDHLILISGRYEGIDERARIALRQATSDKRQGRVGVSVEEISIGPYVLTDGDVAAMVIISSLVRLIPGAINWESLQEESHWNGALKKEEKDVAKGRVLEYPHYTRPEVLAYKGKKYQVPKVLLSGDHRKIEAWRKAQKKSSSS